jgi:Ni/Co efflux regulator RcnB
MKRILLTAMVSSALALGAPGVVAAHDGEHQEQKHQRIEQEHHHGAHRKHAHYARRHRRHHRHAHFLRFGATSAGTPTSASPGTPPASAPANSDERAGTVASFTGGVLTLTLTDGSTVSGKVTDATEIECRSGAPAAIAADHGDHGEENHHGEDNGVDGEDCHGGSQGPGGRDEHGDDNDEDRAEHCTTAALVAGAVVREAELRVSSAGAVWQKVEL